MSLSAQAKVLRVLQEGEVEPVGSARVVKVKVRVVAATNRELQGLIRDGRFREDLYYRLAVLILRTPSLAEHPEDIPLLVLHFAEHFARTNNYRPKKFTEGALRLLAERSWPGNVRELKNFVERLMIMVDGDLVDAKALERFAPSAHSGTPAAGDDRIATLAAYAGAAEALGAAPAPSSGPREGDVAGETWSKLASAPTLSQFQDEAERLYLLRKLAENGWNVTKTAEAIDTPRSNLYKKIDRYGLKRDRTDEDRRTEGVEA
jgi:two-component system nitrogen regulation response regulator NtrX